LPIWRADVGSIFADLHVEHGVELHLGVGVEEFRGGAVAEEVVLADGSSVPGDVFVVGVGVAPRTELVEHSAMDLDNGIVVDEYLATSVAGIWAAGDVANAFHPVLDRRIRLEHWSAALNQGPAAARNMLGRQVPYTKIPYFYSDQYDLGMEYSGLATTWDEVVFRGDRDRREVIVFWLEQGRVVAGMNVNVWDVADQIAGLVASGRRVDTRRLADPSVDLTTLAGD
jgi:3-phenylpropionate/trans-cinnamate dioxygenase ferredoxin reductase subunit